MEAEYHEGAHLRECKPFLYQNLLKNDKSKKKLFIME